MFRRASNVLDCLHSDHLRPLNFALGGLVVCLLGICLGQRMTIFQQSAHIELLAAEKQDIILAENRMLRSRSNFQLPEMGAMELRAITTVALALSWPWELLATGEKTENGGMRLELGIQQIPKDIKLNFPPNLWQRAAAVRIMQEEAGKMIVNDPEVTVIFISRLSKRWKALDSKAWRDNFILNLHKMQENGKGGAVRPSVKPKPKAERRKRK